MALVQVTVSGILKDAGGSLLTSEDLIFTATDVFGDGGTTVPREPVTVTTHATTAAFSVALYTTDGASTYVRYKVRFPNGNRKTFDLTDDDLTVDLDALINAYDGTAGESGSVALALKADIASPTFTGTPAVPTPAQTVNSTQIAPTVFVRGALPIFHLKHFAGGTFNGVADDAAALQAAITSANSADGDSRIILPPRCITKISSAVTANFDASSSKRNADLVIEGGAGSRLLMTGLGASTGINLDNANSVVYKNIFFEGATSGGVSTATADFTTRAIRSGYVSRTRFENCVFAGFGSDATGDGTGLVLVDYGALELEGCRIGGSTMSFSGIFSIQHCYGLTVRNTWFIDYYQANGNFYNKLTTYGAAKNWIKEALPLSGTKNALMQAAYSIEDCVFDEGCTGPALNLGNPRGLVMKRNTHNGGLYASPAKAVKADGFRTVRVEDCWAGLRSDADWESMEFANCQDVVIDNLEHNHGAKWITLSGTTERLDIKRSTLVGNGTYATGINNSAGAVITSDGGV
jgi:hypothetical protein